MIQTLIKLGLQLSHNRGEWDDIQINTKSKQNIFTLEKPL